MRLKPADILDIIQDHASERSEAIKNRDLFEGEHLILQKSAEPGNPNNKVVINYYKILVLMKLGYFMGKAPKLIHKTSDDIQRMIDEILTSNYSEDLFAELSKEADITGTSYLLSYQDENSETKFQLVPREEMVLIKKTGKENEIEYALRYFYLEDKTNKVDRLYCELYTKDEIYYYIETDNEELVFDTSIENNPESHIYEEVPVVEFPNNEERTSELEEVRTLVEAYEYLMSLTMDEIEAFRNAYLAISGGTLPDDEEDIGKMSRTRIIELPEGATAAFLTKPANNQTVENMLEIIEKNIHKVSQVIDTSDDNFAGNLSGVAMEYKLFGMESKCKTKERKMTKGIIRLLKILQPVIATHLLSKGKYKLSDFDIQFSRNIPANEVEQIDNFVKLTATNKLDDETLLARLPFVNNPLSIIEKREKQDEESYGVDFLNAHDEE